MAKKILFKSGIKFKRLVAFAFIASLFVTACGELKKPKTETFYSETVPPKIQEFRWSNGKMPKSFDPAKASAPPETDIVRAIFDGLTDTDPKTLGAIPSIATSWTSADNTRIWTFKLRKDAIWSNGEKVTADDFVRSWKRLVEMGDDLPHHLLLHNFSGVHPHPADLAPIKTAPSAPLSGGVSNAADNRTNSTKTVIPKPEATVPKPVEEKPVQKKLKPQKPVQFGVEAINDFELRVILNEPDEEFPKLVAHPLFRPIFGSGDNFEEAPLGADIVTNGAFRIASVGKDGVTLDREKKYYDQSKIKLERVKFVPTKDADSALAAYKAGEVDVVTNTNFEPLVLKLLTPFVDFRTTTHSAINFYEFNLANAPFNDKRVREALAIAIDRKRLTEGEMEGSTKPAFDFLPFEVERENKFGIDTTRAKELLATAGFPDGEGFPKIRLLVNRNNIQQLIARSVAEMWKTALNIETEVVIRDSKELEELRKTGDFDIVRRGVVLPTADETANMLALFAAERPVPILSEKRPESIVLNRNSNSNTNTGTGSATATASNSALKNNPADLLINTGAKNEKILTEAEAIASIPAIPLYFPTSYSLIKPYVRGFEMNTLDAPSLKYVSIDNSWKPKGKGKQSQKNNR